MNQDGEEFTTDSNSIGSDNRDDGMNIPPEESYLSPPAETPIDDPAGLEEEEYSAPEYHEGVEDEGGDEDFSDFDAMSINWPIEMPGPEDYADLQDMRPHEESQNVYDEQAQNTFTPKQMENLDEIMRILEDEKYYTTNTNAASEGFGDSNTNTNISGPAQNHQNEVPSKSTAEDFDQKPSSVNYTMTEMGQGDASASTVVDECENEDKLVVLGPDHPKMQRFQAVLKEHLERQIYNAESEIRELTNQLKMERKERESLGNQLYNIQFELVGQTDGIKKIDDELEKIAKRREETDLMIKENKCKYEEIREKYCIEIENEKVLMKEVKDMDLLEWCVRNACKEYDGELITRQLIDEKIQKLKSKTEIEKRDQDFYLDKLMTQVQQFTNENAGIERQIKAHQEEQKELNTFIAEAKAEIEALQIEKTHLQRAWNETISVVRARDEALNAARDALWKTKEEIKNKEIELRGLQKTIETGQETHEGSTLLLKRRRLEERQLKSQLLGIQTKNQQMQIQLANLYKVKQQVESDLLKINATLKKKEKEEVGPRKRYELLCQEKMKLEDAIFTAIQEQSALDKAAQHIGHKVQESRNKTRKLEGEVAKVENEMTKMTVRVEQLKSVLLHKSNQYDDLEKKVKEQEKVLQSQAQDIKKSERIIQKKTVDVELLNKKLGKLIEDRGGSEIGPLEKEMEELEKQIAEHRASVVELQDKWLRRQDNLVSLTAIRDDIIKRNDLLRKETFILERKKQRVESELEAKKVEMTKIQKSTEMIRGEIVLANGKLHNDRTNQAQMDKDNILLQNELMNLLKDAELEALELEQEISDLELEKEKISGSLCEANEQCVLWEKKVKLAKELKETLKKEEAGTTGNLKLAIHHMQVRYNELMRAQEKIMKDLELCVDRRDRIIQQADTNLKKANIHPRKTKLNVQRNLNKMRERNRLLLKEAQDSEKEVKEIESKMQELEEKLKVDTEALDKIKEQIAECEQKINEAAVQKHKNLIELILRQQKYKLLESIKQGRYKPVLKSLEALEQEVKCYENKCYTIIDLCDHLLREFPENELQIRLVKVSILPSAK